MADLRHDPALPPDDDTGTFVQTVHLVEGGSVLATARWHAAGPGEGVVQLLELWVDPARLRQGYGRRILAEAIEQARRYHQARHAPLRRVWCVVEQKRHVVGRSFLTGVGFHHVASVGNLFGGQEALIYVRAMD